MFIWLQVRKTLRYPGLRWWPSGWGKSVNADYAKEDGCRNWRSVLASVAEDSSSAFLLCTMPEDGLCAPLHLGSSLILEAAGECIISLNSTSLLIALSRSKAEKQSLISFWGDCLIDWCRYYLNHFLYLYIFFSSRKHKAQQSILNIEIFLCVTIFWVFFPISLLLKIMYS